MIVEITREQYAQAKQMLNISKAKSLLDGELTVVDCIEDIWGVYRVKGVWQSLNRFKANMELIKQASNYEHAVLLSNLIATDALKDNYKFVVIDNE